MTDTRRGVLLGLGAYLCWGMLPLYLKLLDRVLPSEVVAQRVLWSLVLMAALILLRGRWPALRAAFANPRAMLILTVTALLIALNWLIYVWAVANDHVLEGSLGYFLNPLVNVVMGVVFLKERLRPIQIFAVALAAVGVVVLAASAASGLWISLSLAMTFAFYGLLRKIAPVESIEGLTIETILLAPVALIYVLWLAGQGELTFGGDVEISVLLAMAGVVTAVPLLLFAAAARLLRFATLGLLQYLSPTLIFLLAVFAFGEPLTTPYIICFVAIWTGLAIYAADGLRNGRRQPNTPVA